MKEVGDQSGSDARLGHNRDKVEMRGKSANADSTNEGGRILAAPNRAGVVWILLVINVLGSPSSAVPYSIVPIPQAFGQAITMGALLAAFVLALILNPKVRVRSNGYMLTLSVLAFVAIGSSLRLESGLESLARCLRLVLFIATLWLLSRWWIGDMRFARFHVRVLSAVLLTVLAGVLIAPSTAFSGPNGRLAGAIWPIHSTQVGGYSAIVIGLVVLMWLGRMMKGGGAVLIIAPAGALLLLSHTRTALLGLLVGLGIASMSLASSNSRVRRALLAGTGLMGLILLVPNQALVDWIQRGQNTDELTSFTGRLKVWDALLSTERSTTDSFFGVGLTDKSYGGIVAHSAATPNHAIDSSWLAAYHDLGEAGVLVAATMLLVLLTIAIFRPQSPERACAIFLVVYCIVASFTETGLSDASPYLLHLAVAASLLLPRIRTCDATSSGAHFE